MNDTLTPQTQAVGGGLNLSDKEVLATIKATIAQDASDAEFRMFVEFCKGTGLNPFKKEIWFIKTKEKRWYSQKDQKEIVVPAKVQMMTGINGFYAIANSHPQYDGMEETVIERENGRIVRAIAKVWRKDRRFPSVGVAEWKEYAQTSDSGKGMWDTKPSVMICKVAESIALRKAFPNELNGLYTSEEMPKDHGPVATSEPLDVTPKPPVMIEEPREQWYYHPDASPKQVEFLERNGCIEYKTIEVDANGEEIELRGFWKSPKNLGPRLVNFETDKPEDVIEVGIGE